ncbi:MAG: hypothetical protein WCR63_03110 [Bacilli bacterium]
MIKAFLKQDTLRDLYEKLDLYHDSLEAAKTQEELSFRDSMIYEVTCFALPMLDDYFADNLFSMANYQRYRSIIEACTLLSLDSDPDFHKVNSNLLETNFNILRNGIYSDIIPNYIDEKELRKKYEIAKELIEFSLEKDRYHSAGVSLEKVLSQKFPILLGRSFLESIRFFLGYIYENIYIRSGEMIHLIDYRDLSDKYSLTFFNDVTRMLIGLINQYEWNREIKTREKLPNSARQVKKVCLNEFFAVESTILKIENKCGKCFVSKALSELIKLEKSVCNSLLKMRYYDLNSLFKVALEWIVNVDSLTDSSSHLINFNFDAEISKLGKVEREFKFASMKRNLITPNLNWQNKSLVEIVDGFIDSSKKNVKKYCGLSNKDYIKVKYREAKAISHGNGYLALLDESGYALDKELLLNINDLLKETISKLSRVLSSEIDLTVEEQIIIEALNQKYTLLMKL